MGLFRTGCVLCGSDGPALCRGCQGATEAPPMTRVREVGHVPAVFAYAGTGAAIVAALKFRDGRRLVGPLTESMCRRSGGADVVTWVPTSASRRRGRGFDQAELLARALARRLGVPVTETLRRRGGASATGLGRAERAVAVHLVGRTHPWADAGGRLLLVDDVCTTGATLRAARAALTAVGWTDLDQVCVARTP